MPEHSVKRKLRAILSADVKGYSRMMGEDEIGTYQTLTTSLESIRPIISEHNGRIFSSPGDAVMAEFASVVDAVQCAVELQEKIEAANADVAEDQKMQFRIGVNLGDVIHDGEQVYGDGVNIAARIETLAEPGGVSISRNVYNNVHNKLKFGYEYQGEHQVKNIAEPLRVYKVLTAPEHAGQLIGEAKAPKRSSKKSSIAIFTVLALIVAAAIWQFYPRAPEIEAASMEKMAYPLPDKPSIAVLPFTNMSEGSEQAYFSDGLTEEIITALSKVPKLFVIAPNSVFAYKDKSVKVKQVAEDLGVRYVLEGSVRKDGDQIRVTAKLIDALSGHQLWAERYDRNLKEIFSVQDDLTKRIITAMQVKLTEGEYARVASRGTNNLDAYLKYLQAFSQANKLNIEGNELGRQLAQEAIELDPQYSSAYHVLATTHLMDILLGRSKSPKESFAKRIELLKKAIELDGSYAEAYGALGFTYALMGVHDKAIESAERGVSLDPNSSITHLMLGHAYRFSGRAEEAIPEYKKGIRLNPIPPAVYLSGLGLSYSLVGQYEEAIKWCEKAVSQEPNSFVSRLQMTAVYSMAGQIEDARSEAKEVLRLNPKYSLDKAEKRAKIKYKDTWFAALRKAGLPDKPPLPLPDKPSIAVLAFDNLSGDPEQEYFSDGIAENIITALSKSDQLFVIARNSSFTYKGKPVKIQKVGRELGVRYVLEGSVLKSEDRVRISAQLIDAVKDDHLWAERYDHDLKDIFALQDEITMKIVTALQVELTEGEQARMYSKQSKNLDAYLKSMEAHSFWNKGTKESTMRVGQLAQEIIAMDPESPTGYGWLGYYHLRLALFGMSPRENLTKCFELAQKAVSMDESLPDSHNLLGSVYLWMRQYEKAIAAGKRSIELAPNNAVSHRHLGYFLCYAGRVDEGITHCKQGIRLNPFPTQNDYMGLGICYRVKGMYEEALSEFKKALQRSPDALNVNLLLTSTYALLDRQEEAEAAAKKVLELNPNFSVERASKIWPYKNPADIKLAVDALHKAGLK